MNHGTKKGHPEKLLKLSRMSLFPTLSPGRWNGFLERMFFCTDIITRLSAGAKSIFYILVPSFLCLCSRMPLYAIYCPSDGFQSPSTYFRPYGILKRSISLKTTFSANWEIFYPILKSESILSSHSSERCSLSYSFARKALSSARSDSSTNFTAVFMMVWHA